MSAFNLIGLRGLADDAKPSTTAWSAATTYMTNDIVSYDGNLYKSLQDSNTNHAVSDSAWWQKITNPETELAPATAVTLGGIMVGSGLSITVQGTLSVDAMDADDISFSTTGTTITSATVQGALAELDTKVENVKSTMNNNFLEFAN